MILDALFRSAEYNDSIALQVYNNIIGDNGIELLASLKNVISRCFASGSLLPGGDSLADSVADLCILGAKSWMPSSRAALNEAPTIFWLSSYLGKQSTSGLYSAFSEGDRVWSILSYFSWKKVSGLKEALNVLVEQLDEEHELEAREEGMFVQLGLKDDQNRWNPLHRACSKGRVETVRNLVRSDQGYLNKPDASGYLPIHVSIKFNQASVLQIVSTLIDGGAYPNARVQDNEGLSSGLSPLMLAISASHVNKKIVSLLVDKGTLT